MRAVALMAAGALALLGACTPAPDAGNGPAAGRHVLFEGERFGYYQYDAGGGGLGVGFEWNPAESIITIVSRGGRPVGEADRDIAARLARDLCEQTGREFNTRSRGTMLRRGGISFAGDCREW